MTSRIGQRPLNDAERKALKRLLPPLARNLPGTVFRYLLMVVLVFLTLAVAGVMIDMLIRDLWHGPPLQSPLWVDVALVVGIYGAALLGPLPSVLRSHRRRMTRDRALREDLLGGVAEVIEVHSTDATLTWLAREPPICLELSTEQRLLLHGDRLHWDLALFGLSTVEATDLIEEEDEEEDEGEDNDMDDQMDEAWRGLTCFPNSHSVIHRLPHSGKLLRIELHGSPIEPRIIDSPDVALAKALKTLGENPDMESIRILGDSPPSHH